MTHHSGRRKLRRCSGNQPVFRRWNFLPYWGFHLGERRISLGPPTRIPRAPLCHARHAECSSHPETRSVSQGNSTVARWTRLSRSLGLILAGSLRSSALISCLVEFGISHLGDHTESSLPTTLFPCVLSGARNTWATVWLISLPEGRHLKHDKRRT